MRVSKASLREASERTTGANFMISGLVPKKIRMRQRLIPLVAIASSPISPCFQDT
jgi:hypothetical protein